MSTETNHLTIQVSEFDTDDHQEEFLIQNTPHDLEAFYSYSSLSPATSPSSPSTCGDDHQEEFLIQNTHDLEAFYSYSSLSPATSPSSPSTCGDDHQEGLFIQNTPHDLEAFYSYPILANSPSKVRSNNS